MNQMSEQVQTLPGCFLLGMGWVENHDTIGTFITATPVLMHIHTDSEEPNVNSTIIEEFSSF